MKIPSGFQWGQVVLMFMQCMDVQQLQIITVHSRGIGFGKMLARCRDELVRQLYPIPGIQETHTHQRICAVYQKVSNIPDDSRSLESNAHRCKPNKAKGSENIMMSFLSHTKHAVNIIGAIETPFTSVSRRYPQ